MAKSGGSQCKFDLERGEFNIKKRAHAFSETNNIAQDKAPSDK